MPNGKSVIIQELNAECLDEVIVLLKEYRSYMYDELLLSAGKQNFYNELKGQLLLERYQPPHGNFLLVYVDEKAVGCAALKKWSESACEMKRMFVVPEYRGMGLGKLLTKAICQQASVLGYKEILDTNKEMETAVELYRKLGFEETDPYCYNENKQVVYMKKVLSARMDT